MWLNEVEFSPHGPHGSHTEEGTEALALALAVVVVVLERGAVAVAVVVLERGAVAEVEWGETLLLSEEPLSVCDGVVGVEGVES